MKTKNTSRAPDSLREIIETSLTCGLNNAGLVLYFKRCYNDGRCFHRHWESEIFLKPNNNRPVASKMASSRPHSRILRLKTDKWTSSTTILVTVPNNVVTPWFVSWKRPRNPIIAPITTVTCSVWFIPPMVYAFCPVQYRTSSGHQITRRSLKKHNKALLTVSQKVTIQLHSRELHSLLFRNA